MLRIAALAVSAWFVIGLAVALAVGRAARRGGVESVALRQPPVRPAVPRGDELAVRRARRASIGVRVAAAAVAIGVVGAVGSAQGVVSFGQTPASNVKAPAVVDEPATERAPAPIAPRPAAAALERRHEAERLSQPGHAHAQDAPGHDPAGPGRSEDAPGHDPAGPGRSEDARGRQTAPGRPRHERGPAKP